MKSCSFLFISYDQLRVIMQCIPRTNFLKKLMENQIGPPNMTHNLNLLLLLQPLIS